jgi:adenylate cyclase
VRELNERNEQLAREIEQLQYQLRALSEVSRDSERRVVTVLFADLRESTTLAERLAPEHMVALLNSYLGTLARCVLAHGGIVDKFFGDGLMAYFGALDESDGAEAAGHAFLEMRRAVRPLNDVRAAHGEEPIHFGVGIHTGDVVFGLVGVIGRKDYTVLGDTVNTAARLSGLCSGLSKDIVMSDRTAERLRTVGLNVEELGPANIRGKSQPISISTLR